MNPTLVAGLLLVAVAGTAIGVLWLRLKGANEQLNSAAGELGRLRNEVAATQKALELTETIAQDDKRRLEMVISGLKKEIASLEADTQACSDPDVVRSRLQRLLS